MGLSLQDQLLKAGIADKKQAKKAKHEKRIKRKKNKGQKKTPAINQTQQEQLAQAKRSQELNRQLNHEKAKLERLAQVEQLIGKNRLDLNKYEDPYYFKVGNKIKKLYVNEEITKKLSLGKLAIVTFNNLYEIVPLDIANKIAERNPASIVVIHKPDERSKAT